MTKNTSLVVVHKDKNIVLWEGHHVTAFHLFKAWCILQRIADDLPSMPDDYYDLMELVYGEEE